MQIKVEAKVSRYRPGVAQGVGRVITLLFHDRGTRRRCVVSTPRPHFTPGKDPVPILQKAGWASGPVWTGGKSRPYEDSIPDRPARSLSLYRLSYPVHCKMQMTFHKVPGSVFSHSASPVFRQLVSESSSPKPDITEVTTSSVFCYI